jgi:hypothetical protein
LADWREYEELIARLHTQLAPNAVVTHNERVRGRTGISRQLDVTVRQTVGLVDVFIVFECRCYARPVSMGKVEAFVTKLEDVGASQGVMVCDPGFTRGAKRSAGANRVTLMSLREATEEDWASVLGPDSWAGLIISRVEDFQAKALTADGEELELARSAELLDGSGRVVQSSGAVIEQALDLALTLEPVGGFTVDLDLQPILAVLRGDSIHQLATIRVTGTKSARLVLVNLRLASGRVLEDATTGQGLYTEVASQGFDWRAMLSSTPGRPITEKELDSFLSGTHALAGPLHPGRTKRFLRLVARKKGGTTRG